MDTKKLTSVKVEQELFQEFKEECIRHKFSLQKLVDRAIFLYLTEEEFKSLYHLQERLKEDKPQLLLQNLLTMPLINTDSILIRSMKRNLLSQTVYFVNIEEQSIVMQVF